MKNTNETWAIIPARSGSKGFPGKNISLLNGMPLLAHSILFAKKLHFIDKILLSTDSNEYKSIGERYGADVPFLRSANASQDTSMEQDILFDIFNQCIENRIKIPRNILWLRPTHPIRDLSVFINGYNLFTSGNFSSVCVVTPEDPRIFCNFNGCLHPITNDFGMRSMVRRQDCIPAYRIFSGEYFPMPSSYNEQFLGDRLGFVEQSKICNFDIDYEEDLNYLNYLINTPKGKILYGGLIAYNQK